MNMKELWIAGNNRKSIFAKAMILAFHKYICGFGKDISLIQS